MFCTVFNAKRRDQLLERPHSIQPINYPTLTRSSEHMRVTRVPRHTLEHIEESIDTPGGVVFVEPLTYLHVDEKRKERCYYYSDIDLASQ